MIKSVRVEGFRGIREGLVDELEQVNVIVGKNNSGKSSFLEALFLFARYKHILFKVPSDYPYSRQPQEIGYLFYRRKDMHEKALFYGYELQPIRLSLELADGKTLMLCAVIPIQSSYSYLIVEEPPLAENLFLVTGIDWKKPGLGLPDYMRVRKDEIKSIMERYTLSPSQYDSIPEPPPIVEERLSALRSALLIDTIHIGEVRNILEKCWGRIKRRGLDDVIIETLREAYEMNIVSVDYSPSEDLHGKGEWLVSLRNERKYAVGLDDLGDGAKYALAMLAEVMVAEPSLLLIEEPECHHHPKGLERTFDAIFSLVKRMNTQTFVTTHSLEAVNKLIQLSKKHNLTAKIHHFTLKDGVLTSKPLDAPSVEVVTDLGADIRFLDEYV